MDNNNAYILRVFNIADPEDKKLRAIKYPKKIKVNWVHWANNEQILLSTRQTEEIASSSTIINTGYLYVMNKDLGDVKVVLKPQLEDGGGAAGRLANSGSLRQFNNVVVDFLPNDPEHILMSYGIEDQFAPGVYKVNMNTLRKRRIERGSVNFQQWITDLSGNVRVAQGRNERTGIWQMKIKEVGNERWTSHKDFPELRAGRSIFGFTSNPNEMIIGDYDNKDTLGLYIYDLSQKKRTRKLFHHEKYDVNGIIISADGQKVVGASYTDYAIKRGFFDPTSKSQMEKLQKGFTGYQINIIEQTRDGNKVLFKARSPSIPPSLYVYDFSKERIVFSAPDYPEIDNIVQGDVTKVRYTARDGFKIPSYVTTPAKIGSGEIAFKNQPFIIMPHGGPYARDTSQFDYMAQFFASRGYSVLQMNFRGSTGYGYEFSQAGRKNWVLMQEDVEDGAKWLIRKGYADPKRVCIVGWSYGGYAALIAAIKNPDIYACSASIAGVTDLQDMVSDLKRYRFGRHNAQHFLLRGFSGRDDMNANSPVKRAKEISIPIFLAHGTNDVVVHFDQFTRMRRALKSSRAKTTFVKLEDGDHSLINFDHRKELFTELDKFLHDNLGQSEAAP